MVARRSFRGSLRVLAISGLAGGGLVLAFVAGPAAGPVAAVFPPWWGGARAVEAASAGGSVLRLGIAGFVVLVSPDDGDGRDRLRRAGAWFLLDPRGLAGCGLASGANAYAS